MLDKSLVRHNGEKGAGGQVGRWQKGRRYSAEQWLGMIEELALVESIPARLIAG
jgi:hypothetical protein